MLLDHRTSEPLFLAANLIFSPTLFLVYNFVSLTVLLANLISFFYRFLRQISENVLEFPQPFLSYQVNLGLLIYYTVLIFYYFTLY